MVEFVVMTPCIYPRKANGRYIVMLSVLIVVKSVIPIGIEGRKIGVIRFRELYRAEDVVTDHEIVVVRRLPLVVHRERIDISSARHITL